MLIGYVRVSTSRQGQSLDTQRKGLIDVGCDPKHSDSDTINDAKWSRPGLDEALREEGAATYALAEDLLATAPSKARKVHGTAA